MPTKIKSSQPSKPPKLTRSDLESKFQSKCVSWLKRKGCKVWKLAQDATTEYANPDYIGVYEGFWFALEFKKSAKASFRPGQKERIQELNEMSFAMAVYPENYEEFQETFERLLK